MVAQAHSTFVQIEVLGKVESNVIGGGMSGVKPGDPVAMDFVVDSNSYLDNPFHPTRGYDIDLDSFVMTVGGVNVDIVKPQPNGLAYFVLRDNDPAVDGFFISQGEVDMPTPWTVSIPGLTPQHDLDFSRTFANGSALHSLDILDAVGFYNLGNLSSYNWTIGRFGNPGAIYDYESISIKIVPEPVSLTAMGIGLAAMLRRRQAKTH